MNLGQLIGQLRLAADEEMRAARRERPGHVGSGRRQKALLALLEDGRVLSANQIAAALNLSQEQAAVMVGNAYRRDLIARHGERCKYRYSKLGVVP